MSAASSGNSGLRFTGLDVSVLDQGMQKRSRGGIDGGDGSESFITLDIVKKQLMKIDNPSLFGHLSIYLFLFTLPKESSSQQNERTNNKLLFF
jgi:hypothetical protein